AKVHLSGLRHVHQAEAAGPGRPQPAEWPGHHDPGGADPHLHPGSGAQGPAQQVSLPADTELVDLHIHVGGSVAPHILWSIAHEHGYKLPVKNFWEFRQLVTADPTRVHSLGDYLDILHQWTEKIQSSPHAIERSVYEIIGKEYRASHVSLIELRFNPMKRNLGGERDLDHIICAALRGMDRACLEYGVSAAVSPLLPAALAIT